MPLAELGHTAFDVITKLVNDVHPVAFATKSLPEWFQHTHATNATKLAEHLEGWLRNIAPKELGPLNVMTDDALSKYTKLVERLPGIIQNSVNGMEAFTGGALGLLGIKRGIQNLAETGTQKAIKQTLNQVSESPALNIGELLQILNRNGKKTFTDYGHLLSQSEPTLGTIPKV